MTGINCPTCDRPVPADWPYCPHCGRPVRPLVHRRRPIWVYFVVGLYLLLVLTVLDAPILITALYGDGEPFLTTVIMSAVVFAIGASLLVIPIRTHLQRPVRRRSIALPLIVSAVCAAMVFASFGLASDEFAFGSESTPVSRAFGNAIWVGTAVVWLGWMVLFGWLSRSVAPQTINDRMYQLLLAGSVVELLVALPMHLVVRRRTECCAGFATGLGIGVGLVVMLIALGPAVFFLFYRRYRQAQSKRPLK